MKNKEELTKRLLGFANDCIVAGVPLHKLAIELAQAIEAHYKASLKKKIEGMETKNEYGEATKAEQFPTIEYVEKDKVLEIIDKE